MTSPTPSPVTPAPGAPVATVVFATRNRKDELARSLRSCFAQTVPLEIVVRDDGSTDGTDAMMAAEFPTVNYRRNDTPRGSIVNRNEACRAATTNYIFSLDDDAEFMSPTTVADTLRDFDHPRVWAVAIPYIDVNYGPKVWYRSEDGALRISCFFRGCAAAWRRDVFLAMGGYREVLVHMYEEPEVCLRALEHGFVTRLGSAQPVHHYESAVRNVLRIQSLLAKNTIMGYWMNVPMPTAAIRLLGTTVRSLIRGVQSKAPWTMMKAVGQGWGAILRGRARRSPVRPITFWAFHNLGFETYPKLTDFESKLPALEPDFGKDITLPRPPSA